MTRGWTLEHKKYAIIRLGQMERYQTVLDELRDPDIGAKFGFEPLPSDYTYQSFYEKMKRANVQKKIDKLRAEYLDQLKKDLPLTDDEIKKRYLQEIADDPNTSTRDRIKAIDQIHKIEQTKAYQEALAKSGSVTNVMGIDRQVLENLLASLQNEKEADSSD